MFYTERMKMDRTAKGLLALVDSDCWLRPLCRHRHSPRPARSTTAAARASAARRPAAARPHSATAVAAPLAARSRTATPPRSAIAVAGPAVARRSAETPQRSVIAVAETPAARQRPATRRPSMTAVAGSSAARRRAAIRRRSTIPPVVTSGGSPRTAKRDGCGRDVVCNETNSPREPAPCAGRDCLRQFSARTAGRPVSSRGLNDHAKCYLGCYLTGSSRSGPKINATEQAIGLGSGTILAFETILPVTLVNGLVVVLRPNGVVGPCPYASSSV